MIRILVVDDHQLVGEGTKTMLENEEDFTVQYISRANEVLNIEDDFDIYLIDIHMPGISGIDLSKELLNKNKNSKIILYTGLTDFDDISLFTQIGISGVISKTSTNNELVSLIRSVLSGYTIVPLSLFNNGPRKNRLMGTRITENELNILKHLADGLTNKEIADKTFVSHRSIEYQLTKIYRKLNVNSREEAIAEGIRRQII